MLAAQSNLEREKDRLGANSRTGQFLGHWTKKEARLSLTDVAERLIDFVPRALCDVRLERVFVLPEYSEMSRRMSLYKPE